MNTCETCKHWGDIYSQYVAGYREQMDGCCDLTIAEHDGEDTDKDIAGKPGSKAHCQILFPDVLDGIFARSILVTTKDFSCIQHEPKDTP